MLTAPNQCPLVGPYDVPTTGATMRVRYHVHLLRNTNGTGGIPLPRVEAMLAQMEASFAAVSVNLVEVGGRSIINDTGLNGSPTGALVPAPYGVNPYAGAVNVYLGVGGAGAVAVAVAVSTVSTQGLAISIPGAAIAMAYRNTLDTPTVAHPTGEVEMRVLAHEMGHALGLIHTQEITSDTTDDGDPCTCAEAPNGSNGNTCGDLVQDTPADPEGMVNAMCEYTGDPDLDPDGTIYDPLTRNIMSYYRGCRASFTAGQTSRMIAVTLLQNSVVVEEATLPADFAVRLGYTTSLTDATIRLGSGAALMVTGRLDATGTTFTALSPALGWAGVRFQPGSGGAWTSNTAVELVAGGGNPAGDPPPTHMVTVTDASPTFTDVRLQFPVAGTGPVDGFYVTEAASPQNAVVITRPEITGMTGGAVVANGPNVRVEVVRGQITGSDQTAVQASGSGTNVYLVPALDGSVLRGPQITGNEGGGVAVAASAAVRFGAPSPGNGLATVSGNTPGRGLYAAAGGLVYAGTSSVYQRNRIFGNGGPGSTGNALAFGSGSAVYARCNWWNTETPPFRTGVTGAGTVNVSAPLAADPYVNPTAACGGIGPGGPGRPGDPTFSGAVAGRDGETVADRLLAAVEAAPEEAVGVLAGIVEDHPESAEATAALAEAGGIAGRPGTPAFVVAEATGLMASSTLRG